MNSDFNTCDFGSEVDIDDNEMHDSCEHDTPDFDRVPSDNMSEWSVIDDSSHPASVHNRTQHWRHLQSSQRGSHVTANRDIGTPRLHRSLHAPNRPVSSLSRPDPSLPRPASIQVTSVSSGKPRPKSGLRRPLSLQPQSWDDIRQRDPDISKVGTVLPDNPCGKRQKLPLKAPSSGMVQLTRVAHASRCPVVLRLWSTVMQSFSAVSPMLSSMSHSTYAEDHANRFLDQFAASTLVKYLSALIAWLRICEDMHVDPWSLNDSSLADIICASALARRSDGQGPKHSVTLKALRWAHKRLQIPCLACVFEPICNSFHSQKTLGDRRESLPYSLFVLCQWERRILSSTSSEFEILVLGSFLFLLWSGLRFSDMQRSFLSSWQFTLDELRGISWRTKTAANVSFGLISRGFLSWGEHGWMLKWLTTLDELHSRSHSDSSVDFVLPVCSPEGVSTPLQPMSYTAALYYLRVFILLPWKSSLVWTAPKPSDYTLHGLKSTLITWATQLNIPEEQRRLQGKHKAVQSSTRLYSRDDVFGALALQNTVRKRVSEGWKPATPLARGGQLPLMEPSFVVECFKKSALQREWKFFSFREAGIVYDIEEGDEDLNDAVVSSSSSDSGSVDSSDASDSKVPSKKSTLQPVDQLGPPEEFQLGLHGFTWHVMVTTDDARDVPCTNEGRWRTACGRHLMASRVTLHTDLDMQTGQSLRFHPGCRKGWSSLNSA